MIVYFWQEEKSFEVFFMVGFFFLFNLIRFIYLLLFGQTLLPFPSEPVSEWERWGSVALLQKELCKCDEHFPFPLQKTKDITSEAHLGSIKQGYM